MQYWGYKKYVFCLYVFIPVTHRVKRYTRFFGKYVRERSVSDPIKYI